MNIFRKTKMLEEKIDKLIKELREADETNYKCSETIVDLNNKLQQAESDCSRMQDKMNTLEDELNILRNERKEIEDKTKEGIDKDAAIVQLIIEKDRLTIENLKYHAQLIEKDRFALEFAKLNASSLMYQAPILYTVASCNSGFGYIGKLW